MILYHGTTMEIPIPMILRSEIGRDFGSAFYTTDIQERALAGLTFLRSYEVEG